MPHPVTCVQLGSSASEQSYPTHALQDSTVLRGLAMIPSPVLWGLLVIGQVWLMRPNAHSAQEASIARLLAEQQ